MSYRNETNVKHRRFDSCVVFQYPYYSSRERLLVRGRHTSELPVHGRRTSSHNQRPSPNYQKSIR
jgi:hypothetical protein